MRLSFARENATIGVVTLDLVPPVSNPSHDVNPRLTIEDRLIYPPAYEAIRPFFDPTTQWGRCGQEHLAYHTLKDHFPELSSQEVFLIIATAKRLFANGIESA